MGFGRPSYFFLLPCYLLSQEVQINFKALICISDKKGLLTGMAAGGAARGAETQFVWAADSTEVFLPLGLCWVRPCGLGAVYGACSAGDILHNSLEFADFLALPECREFCYFFLITKLIHIR